MTRHIHQTIILRKKVAKMNECMLLAVSLNVEFRCSLRGISILHGTSAKFFDIDKLYLDNSDCKKYIKECASPDLQTTLSIF